MWTSDHDDDFDDLCDAGMSRKFEILNNKVENAADETVFPFVKYLLYLYLLTIYVIKFTEMSKYN